MKHILYALFVLPVFLTAQSAPGFTLSDYSWQPGDLYGRVETPQNPLSADVREMDSETNMWIAPNPSIDVLNVYLRDRPGGNITITVFNLLGKLLYEFTPQTQQDNLLHREDVSDWLPGTYLVRVSSDDRTIRTVRFVKR